MLFSPLLISQHNMSTYCHLQCKLIATYSDCNKTLDPEAWFHLYISCSLGIKLLTFKTGWVPTCAGKVLIFCVIFCLLNSRPISFQFSYLRCLFLWYHLSYYTCTSKIPKSVVEMHRLTVPKCFGHHISYHNHLFSSTSYKRFSLLSNTHMLPTLQRWVCIHSVHSSLKDLL